MRCGMRINNIFWNCLETLMKTEVGSMRKERKINAGSAIITFSKVIE
jgi:hypothetical protein